MVSRSDAIVNLSSLLRHAPGAPSEVTEEGLLLPTEEQQAEDGVRLAGPIAWQVNVQSTGGDDDYFVDGELSGTAIMECRRCLENVETEIETNFVYEMIYQPGKATALTLLEAPLAAEANIDEHSGDDTEDRLVFGRPEVDFAPLLRQLFAIELPLTVLCNEDCRGLSVDGVNLNEHPDHVAPQPVAASIQDDVTQSPFAALADLDVES